MISLDLRTVGKVAVKVCSLAVYGLLATKSFKVKVDMSDGHSVTAPGYGDAVTAIVKSDMLDSTKNEIVSVLKRDEYVDYYRSVISIVNSDMLDSYKRNMIESLNEK